MICAHVSAITPSTTTPTRTTARMLSVLRFICPFQAEYGAREIIADFNSPASDVVTVRPWDSTMIEWRLQLTMELLTTHAIAGLAKAQHVKYHIMAEVML